MIKPGRQNAVPSRNQQAAAWRQFNHNHTPLKHTPETDYGLAKKNAVAFLFAQTEIKRIYTREMC